MGGTPRWLACSNTGALSRYLTGFCMLFDALSQIRCDKMAQAWASIECRLVSERHIFQDRRPAAGDIRYDGCDDGSVDFHSWFGHWRMQ